MRFRDEGPGTLMSWEEKPPTGVPEFKWTLIAHSRGLRNELQLGLPLL